MHTPMSGGQMRNLGRPSAQRTALLVGAAGWCAVVVLLLIGLLIGTVFGVSRWVDDLFQLATAALAAGCCALAALRSRGRHRLAWWAIFVGTCGWLLGQAVWSFQELALGIDRPFPSPADLGFLIFPVAVSVGVAALPAERARRHWRDVVDGLIIALALTCLSWTTSLGDALDGGPAPWASILSIAYPVTDVAVLTMALLAVARAGAHRATPVVLATAIATMVGSDAVFAAMTAANGHTSGAPVGLGWCAAFVLIAAAALRPEQSTAQTPQNAQTTLAFSTALQHNSWGVDSRLFFLLYAPLVVAALAASVRWALGRPPGAVEGSLLLLTVGLVLVRQYVTMRDNRVLLAEVTARSVDLRRQEEHDPLTGLANRAQFTEHVARALAQHTSEGTALAVLFCDLDDFKSVNDGLGHAAGDQLLVAVAERLARTLRATDTLARLGGDEFAILVQACGQPRRAPEVGLRSTGADDGADALGARAIAERLGRTLAPAFALAGSQVSVRLSIGVAGVSSADPTPAVDRLLSRADIAMYTAKRAVTRRPVVYRSGLALPESADWRLRPLLEQALRDGAVVPHYQPIVQLETGRLHGFEALARWQRGGAEHEVVLPSVFLPIAARAGLLPTLTAHMLRTASAQLAEWTTRPGLGHLRVAVNVPPAQIIDPDFPGLVRRVLDDYDVPVGGLVLEITEEALLADVDRAADVAGALRAGGLLVSLDDFGVGYSSLAHLHRLPLDVIKLDRAFVQNVDTDADLRRLITGLIALSADLGLTVIAEGIESEAQARALGELGCTLGQGFLFAAAGDPSRCEPLLDDLAPPRLAASARSALGAAAGGWGEFGHGVAVERGQHVPPAAPSLVEGLGGQFAVNAQPG